MRRTHITFKQFIRTYRIILVCILVVGVVGCTVVVASSVSPSNFPRNLIIHIDKDMTVAQAGMLLKERGIIRSPYLFNIYSTLLRDGKGIQAGSYLFDEPQSILRVAYRLSYGVKNVEKIKLTIFEGTSVQEMAALMKKKIPGFDAASFVRLVKSQEGYLFPETYFVEPDVRPEEIIDIMRGQFDVALRSLETAIATSSHSLADIITMASIIEKEANRTIDRRMISGILWKRIEKGMALQVDVPFYYIFNKGSQAITLNDLATTSPYNTYLHKGLTPTPITNPGLDAIKAALYPTSSAYYFYLADRGGTTHYAATYDGHVDNKMKYLQ